jgi:hypothetical protein
MNFCLSRIFALSALGMALAGGAVWAQQTIDFSKPSGTEPVGLTNVFQSLTQERSEAVDAYHAPQRLFGTSGAGRSFDVLPGSPGGNAVSPATAREWQRILEDKKNWSMLTPAEILGVTTPEKILGISDPRQQENLSPEERFLKRLNEASMASATNSYQRSASFLRDDAKTDASGQTGQDNLFERIHAGAAAQDTGPNSLFNPLSAAALNSPAGAVATPDSVWGSPFGRPAPAPAPTLEQQAEMNRFRALMEPSAPEEKQPLFTHPSPAYTPAASASPATMVNPAGHSYTPLTSNLGRPVGVKPVSGITGPYVTPSSKPKTASQLPPWLLDPSENSPLQRRF